MNESIPNWSVRRFTQCIEIVQISALCIFFVCSRSQKKISPTRIITPWTLDKNMHKKPLPPYQYYPTGEVKKIVLGSQIELSYTYHISGALKTAEAKRLPDGVSLFSETLYYEDCGKSDCEPQYNGNISRMVHEMAVDGDHERLRQLCIRYYGQSHRGQILAR